MAFKIPLIKLSYYKVSSAEAWCSLTPEAEHIDPGVRPLCEECKRGPTEGAMQELLDYCFEPLSKKS